MSLWDFIRKKPQRTEDQRISDKPNNKWKIVFGRSGQGIMIMNADGSRLTRILDWGESPTVSPDARKIAFYAYPHLSEHRSLESDGVTDFSPEIHTMDLNGGNVKRLTLSEEMGASSPKFSPDGKRLAFFRTQEAENQIWLMDVDSKNIKQLTYEGNHSYFSWMPDGRIAFQRQYGELHSMDSDGRNVEKIGIFEKGDDEPVWSPDGTKVAYSKGADLFVMLSNGQNRRQITVLKGCIGTWSPDSQWLVFSSRKINHDSAEIFIDRYDGKYEQRLTQNRPRHGKVAQDLDPCWLP